MNADSFEKIISTLADGDVDFIVIGGLAAIAMGAARATYDVDVVYSRSPENIKRLCHALKEVKPYLRGAPPGLPFQFDQVTVSNGLNFTLTTTLGDLDLLGEVAGGGSYDKLLAHTAEVVMYGKRLRCVKLETLIQLKLAAGRPKDFDAIAELRMLLKNREKEQEGSH